MAFPAASRKFEFVSCPRAFTANGPEGQVMVITVSTSADYINLQLGASQAVFDRTLGNDKKSIIRNYLTISCDVDLGLFFGPTAAIVNDSGAVPAIATAGTLSGGAYTAAAKTCFVLYAKQPARFLLQPGVDLFMGFVASGSGTMRLYQSSSDNA